MSDELMQMDNWLADPFFGDLERRFFTPYTDARTATNAAGALKTDIEETNDQYVATMDVPGINKDDIHLRYSDNVLTVDVQHDEQHDAHDQHGKVLMSERNVGAYTRGFELPSVDASQIKASYKDGVLTVTMPKVVKDQSQHQIDVQ